MDSGQLKGKIIKGIGGFYYVHDGISRVWECRARGSLRNRELRPLVGDEALIEIQDEAKGLARVEDILPRRNELIRPAVANMDRALILVSATTPAFHPGLLDRFLLWMSWQGIPTVVGIGKLDEDGRDRHREIAAVYEGAGFTVCSFSARTGEGLEALREQLLGRTTVLAGASGVGKTTLLNALIPEAAMETGGLSRLERGRHTTRHSEIFFLAENSFLLDTPGFTSLSAPDMDALSVREHYPEFEEPARGCRFPDCAHLKERDCGVRQALEEGRIAQSRYAGYTQIMEEIRSRRRYG